MLTVSEGFKTAISAESRQFAAYVEFYFDGVTPTVFSSDDTLVSFNLLEELSAPSDSPLGLVSSNEIEVVLENSTRNFTPTNPNSPYFGRLIPTIKVKPFIGLKVNGSFEYISLGTFYTEDWDAPGDKILVSIRCNDIMIRTFDKTMPQVPVFETTTITELYSELFELAGLTASDYIIDSDVSQSFKYGWYEKGKYKEAVQKLVNTSCTSVFTTKDSKVRVRNSLTAGNPVFTFYNTDQVKTSAMPIKYLDTYSKVVVDYKIPYIDDVDDEDEDQQSILKLTELEIPTTGLVLERSAFSSGPVGIVEQIVISDRTDLTIGEITYGAWDITINISSVYAGTKKIDLEIFGRVVETTDASTTRTNTELQALIGDKEITLSPYLIQSKEAADLYADIIDNLVHDPASKVVSDVRGNPAIELGDVVTIVNPSHKMSAVDIIVTRMTTDFSGGLTSTIEGFTVASLTYPYIRPLVAETTSTGIAPVIGVT